MSEYFSFKSDDATLVGTLHRPLGTPKGVVVITGPLTSVKEQAPGAYAAAMAEEGFTALAFDHRHFGESDGAPRQYENPDQKIADVSAAVTALKADVPGLPIFALGVCAGAGYMASAVAQDDRIKAFGGVAGFYHDAAQSKEWMGDGYDDAIAKGQAAREVFEATGNADMIPAVAKEGERAMPMDEAFEYYGTDRGGEATFPNYKNQFAVMSRETTTPYDVMSAAEKIAQPVLMIHSEDALSPMLARRFAERLPHLPEMTWVDSTGQIDFYDDPKLIGPAAAKLAKFFAAQA